jgi:ABC-type lipoprotein export system ATPase subunit
MLLRKIALTNCRSFLERAELTLDGPISIVIGPNGGGKTNLLDAAVVMLRRYLFASMYAAHTPRPEQAETYEFRHNDALNNMVIEPHSDAKAMPQVIEVEIEVTKRDLEAMKRLKQDAEKLLALSARKYRNANLAQAANWTIEEIAAGTYLNYKLESGRVVAEVGPKQHFLEFLQSYEIDGWLWQEYGLAPLSTPMVYLPVNRASNGLQSSIQLSSYNEFEQKRQIDSTWSRNNQPIMALAVARLAQKYVDVLYQDKGQAQEKFKADPNISELTILLGSLGYEWELVPIDKNKNAFDVQLKKQGSRFFVRAASSGECELLTYLFAIYALNVRDALIVVDEPELHLHPKWQKALLDLFVTLSEKTGNQFLLATHAPTFVSPNSIQYVSRVFCQNQKSRIVQLQTRSWTQLIAGRCGRMQAG